MTATVRDGGPFEKVVSFSVSKTELDAQKTKTARRLSKDLNIRGFRPGKAPRPIVESTVGSERLTSEAVDDLLPVRLESVLTEHELRPAVTPELSNLEETGEGLDVEVKVTLWPVLDAAPNYRGRTVVVEDPALTEEDIDVQVERLRDQFAELEVVDRPAAAGDYVTVDLSADAAGEDVPEARAEQLLYEVGSGGLIDGADEALVGVTKGDERNLESILPRGFGDRAGLTVNFKVKVHDVQAKVLPEVSDEWISEVTEFDTLAELRADLAGRMGSMKRRIVLDRFRERALDQLVEDTEVELPEALIRAEMDEVLHRFVHRLEGQGVTLEDYFEVADTSSDEFMVDLRSQAIRSLGTRIVLEEVGKAEGLTVTPEEVATALSYLARQSEQPEEFIRTMAKSGRSLSLAGDILRNKALDVIVSQASAVDEDGNPLELEIDDEPADGLAEEVVGELVTGEEVVGEVVVGEIVMEEVGELVSGEVEEEE